MSIAIKEKIILELAKKTSKICFTHYIKKNKFLIVDFYNIYCNIIKFNKYKTFSKESWIYTMKCILNSIPSNSQIFIVSKNIYEVDDICIQTLTKLHTNMTYIIIEDLCVVRGLNRERDDYFMIILHYILEKRGDDCMIITNDNFSNYIEIIFSIKRFDLKIFKNGILNIIPFSDKSMKAANCLILNYKQQIVKTNFYYDKKILRKR